MSYIQSLDLEQCKVSICCITYNHHAYIAEAISSFLMQNAKFKFEIVIADDASTDGTEKIIEDFAKKYPDKIKFYRHNKNLGMMGNFFYCLEKCKSEYVSFCEGDDYFVDSMKLQKQFDLMEQNKQLSACCHNVNVYNQTKNEIEAHHTRHDNGILKLYDLIFKMPKGMIATSTLFCRRKAIGDLGWISQLAFGDFPLWINLYKFGPIYSISDNMSVYRKHDQGFTNGFNWDGYINEYPKFYNSILPRVPDNLTPLVLHKIFDVYYHSGSQFIARGQYQKAKAAFRRMISYSRYNIEELRSLGVLGCKLLLYPVYQLYQGAKNLDL